MGCKIHIQNPQPRYYTPRPYNVNLFAFVSSLQIKNNNYNKKITQKGVENILASSISNLDQQQQKPNSKRDVYKEAVKFQTLGGCKLGISRYPDFQYNAEGGKGTGTKTEILSENDEIFFVDFDLKTLYIPPLTSQTTRFLGLPLPPFLKIDIVPQLFQGRINRSSGKVELEFKAKFFFSAGNIYKAPPLMVETVLTSEESRGTIRSGKGARLDGNGRCTLVGVAIVQPINDSFMNSFLSLPTECLANLNAIITFSSM